jgi:hypothetical protein
VFDDLLPAMLMRFDPEQWPADDLAASYQLWRETRKEFANVHGWPGGFLEMLIEGYNERKRVFFPDAGPPDAVLTSPKP